MKTPILRFASGYIFENAKSICCAEVNEVRKGILQSVHKYTKNC